MVSARCLERKTSQTDCHNYCENVAVGDRKGSIRNVYANTELAKDYKRLIRLGAYYRNPFRRGTLNCILIHYFCGWAD